ncbi:hypothetical protein [Rhinolophus gammaherpesvirus 1]|uniref:Uncharacterized protein n=1 Tax=Rhinolophus gammaherpesvirus 1 TaxID=2054179 RepID=A0A2Z5U640_9GAMA|nr:hypothetical protein [Rhinolophus gammaherpesvirus 1]BBB06468.1 hypothetical protein [Rhinolophus gammaherpesvirus 1]
MSHNKRRWSPSVAFWSPSPKNSLYIDRESLTETRRHALRIRRALLQNRVNKMKSGLLTLELDNLARLQVGSARAVLSDLQLLELATLNLDTNHGPPVIPPTPKSPSSVGPSDDGDPQTHSTQHQSREMIISISPDGPSFSVNDSFRTEFLSGLYHRQTQWLPFYGPWYSSMTDSAMQRRVFPKELKGNINFQNSTSLKLITSVLDTLASVTEDIYSDLRHMSDTNAALCLINGYHCLRTNSPLPVTHSDLLVDLDKKIEFLVGDLKQDTSRTDFSFLYSNPKQMETMAPLNKQGTYAQDFFLNHKLFHLMESAGMFTHSKQTHPGSGGSTTGSGKDVVYLITNSVFGQDIPPFLTHQWNLRTGLKALEVLIVVYILLESANVGGNTVHRRLQLSTLLPEQLKRTQHKPGQFARRGVVFSFLVKNYMVPILTHHPQTPSSSLFPGVMLLATESADMRSTKSSSQLVNLSGRKFDELFEILNQKLVFRDAHALIRAQTSLRMTVETGLNLLLSKASPITSAAEIINTQFGGGDDYDTLYFLVLGCLPVTMPVV